MGAESTGRFIRDVREVAGKRSWDWVKGGYLKKETEGLVFFLS